MSILQTLGGTAADVMSQMGPMAGRVREGADELFERIGSESRQLGEMMSDRVGAQLEQLPEATLKRLNVVPARKSRRRMILAMLLGMVVGAVVMKVLSNSRDRGYAEVTSRQSWNEPQAPAAVTGEVPR